MVGDNAGILRISCGGYEAIMKFLVKRD